MKRNLLYLLPLFLLLSGCSLASEDEPTPEKTYLLQRKLSNITFDTGGRMVIDLTYSYNDLDQLVRIGGVTVRDSVRAHNITLNYDSQGRLVHLQNTPKLSWYYTYNDKNQLVQQVRRLDKSDGTKETFTYQFIYNPENRVVESETHKNINGTESYVGNMQYIYPAENKVTVTSVLASGEKYREYSIVTDDQKKPLNLPLRFMPAFFDSEFAGDEQISDHNTISETVLHLDEQKTYGGSYKASYTYNEAGYPIECVKTFEQGSVEKITYVYAVK